MSDCRTSDTGRGQYDLEYRGCACFWGHEPAKFVRLIPHALSVRGAALDLGAGEGKNSFFLRNNGFKVDAVEISRFAVRNFVTRLIADDVDDITVILGDALTVPIGDGYQVVVAYGMLHCLASRVEISELISRIQDVTAIGGLNVISSFTDKLAIPEEQSYLSPTLLKEDEILQLYGSDWHVLNYENDVITETHPTSRSEHEHSLFRMMVRKEG